MASKKKPQPKRKPSVQLDKGEIRTEAEQKIAEVEQRLDPTKTVTTIPLTNGATKTGSPTSQTTSPLSKMLGQLAEEQSAPQPPHLIIEARAGTGKTTTLVQALKLLRGEADPGFIPSPQQAAIFEQVLLSPQDASVCFVAFNKAIAVELGARVPPGCDAMTMHSLGYKAVNKAMGYQKPDNYATENLVAEIMGVNARAFKRTNPILLGAVAELVDLCKQNLVDLGEGEEELDRLCRHYEVECGKFRPQIFDLVPQVLEASKSPKGTISFTDMIWLPVVLDLPVPKYDVLLIDEFHDLNRCQQALAKMAGKRLIGCGDSKQAIYGFAGADAESMSRMFGELNSTEAGCVKLSLTVTRRCGHAIVAEAKRIVPDFEAFHTNPEGKISEASFPRKAEAGRPEVTWEKSYGALASDGDMLLCRVNAPLVSQCFKFIKMGRKATIRGRDVAKGLVTTVNKMRAVDCVDLVHKLSDWANAETAKEQAKRNPSEQRLIAIGDRLDCLLCFTEGCRTVEEVLAKIDKVFCDKQCPRCKRSYGSDQGQCYDCKCGLVKPDGIQLSSVHKAKGLESRRVFLLQPKGATIPHPMCKSKWQIEQEYNILYVAVTRAIEELIYVS